MRLLGSYLWKEWRDHRAVLIGMVLAVPLLLVVMGLSLPRKAFDYDGFAGVVALACLATFVVSLTTDLVPGEARRGHLLFLERLPGGLGAAFRGKLLLFAAGATLFAAYGYLAGAITCRLVAGAWPAAPSPGTVTGIGAIAALWTFAVSCALPRGALSVPAVAALALLLGLPIFACWRIDPAGPESWWRWESAALWGAGGIVAAWAAFRRRGPLRAGRACLVVGAVCATPYWADAAYYAFCPEPLITDGYVGEGGRYAFLNRVRKAREHVPRETYMSRALPPVIVDLRTGVAREVGSPQERFRARSTASYESTPQRYVALGLHVLDARTAQPAQPTEQELRDARRAATPWRLPDGRRLWWFAKRLEAEAKDGGVEVVEEPWEEWSSLLGFGFEGPRSFYDLSRRRFYKRAELGLRGYTRFRIRPGRWVVLKKDTYELFDPDARTLAPVAGLMGGDHLGAMLDDSRLFVGRGTTVLLLDPETGAATPVALPHGTHVIDPGHGTHRTPDGRRVFRLWDGSRSAFGRFDPATDTLTTTGALEGYCSLLGCPTDGDAIVRDRQFLWRLRFGSDEREEIWRAR